MAAEPPDGTSDSPLGEVSLEEAHRRSTDREGRLLGESTEDVIREDAAHWMGVYDELVRFKRELLEVLRSRRRHMSLDANIEGGADEVLLRTQLERYERRRQEWQEALSRLMDAPGAVTSPPPLVIDRGPLKWGLLQIDPRHRTVIENGHRRALTPTEWQLLRVFLEQPGVVIDRDDLAERAWGAAYRGRRGEVEVYVSRLRRKLQLPESSAVLETVRGRGYRLLLPPATPSEEESASPQQ
jgi:DNA-binding response OmpR family regulator